jgi:hypothetical protein
MSSVLWEPVAQVGSGQCQRFESGWNAGLVHWLVARHTIGRGRVLQAQSRGRL